ncbi:MAG: ethylbenzene dehydrogenase-related protein [Armatimonadota bacterium]|nr:ethylbenzene dehydrogenase-related protein [Armatimonadota bacterium]MDR7426539.1 ethylbenzene dehydrogenase-related protein [Armatimonadota bacterium]MDR7471019.1 ethylbenzene dehydrogenase-related protein [Armatimonadota bacterium]
MNVRRMVAVVVAALVLAGTAVFWAVGAPEQPPIQVRLTKAPIPLDVARAAHLFAQAEARTIPLIPQNLIRPHGGGTVKEVRLRALHDGRMVYLELSWRDPTSNRTPTRQGVFTDAAAVQFPVNPGVLPNPFMGDRQRPVNIWQWKAAWQDELARPRDLRAAYPHMSVDYYYDSRFLKEEAKRRAFNAGAAAGNLLSLPRRVSAVEDLVAWGFGTLTSQPQQDVVGLGLWQAGRWTVLLARPLRTTDPADVQFLPGETVYVNFAVWDGGNGDRDGQKNVTLTWWPLRLSAVR